MNEKEYKGQKIMAEASARLVPPNDHYPDCQCFLVATERSFFVLEDNYDNTYTEHFFISLDKICNMNVLVNGRPDNDIHMGESTGGGALATIVTAIVGLFAGLIILPIGSHKPSEQMYLRVDYLDEWSKMQEVYFREIDSAAKKIVKYWQSYRKEKGAIS